MSQELLEKLRDLHKLAAFMPSHAGSVIEEVIAFLESLDKPVLVLESPGFVTKGQLYKVDPFTADYTTHATGPFKEFLETQGYRGDMFSLPTPIYMELRRPEFVEIIVRRDPERS